MGGLGGSFTHEMANCNVLYHNECNIKRDEKRVEKEEDSEGEEITTIHLK